MSTFFGFNLDLLSVTICPVLLNTRSDSTDDAGMQRYFWASCFRDLKSLAFT